MTVLITGAGGFLGSNLVKYISEKTDYKIISIGLNPLNRERFHNETFLQRDLLIPDALHYEMNYADWVFDFASIIGGFKFLKKNFAKIMHDSTIMNLNVLEAARKAGVKKILFASSACVYPSNDKGIFYECDSTPFNPENEYGFQKIFIEQVYKKYSETYELQIYLPRFQNVYGPYIQFNGPRSKGLADICRKVMEADNEIEIFGDGEQVRDYTFSEDAMEGTLKLIESDIHEPVNISSGKAITINEYVKEIISALNKNVKVSHSKEKDTGVKVRVSVNDKAKKELGWEPTTPLSIGIKKMTDWMLTQMEMNK